MIDHSMPRNRVPLSEMGVLNSHKEGMRAHIQFRADGEKQKYIYGPSRSTDEEAQKDLDQIRAAGSVGSTLLNIGPSPATNC